MATDLLNKANTEQVLRNTPSYRTAQLRDKTDEELIELLQAGTMTAYDVLVARYTGPLTAFLYRFVGDVQQCEDLLQETFLRMYRNRHAYRRIARFSTWLYTIAGNLARSEYRRRKRNRVVSMQLSNNDDESYELEIPDPSPTPEVYAADSLLFRYVQEALAQIQPDYREVVVLRDVQQLSYEEIAEITGLPLGTVKSRINRGRTRLQELLRDVYRVD